jgi:hypothetical protein
MYVRDKLFGGSSLKNTVIILIAISWVCIASCSGSSFSIVSSDIDNISIAIISDDGKYFQVPVSVMGDMSLNEVVSVFKIVEALNSSNSVEYGTGHGLDGLEWLDYMNDSIVLLRGSDHYFLYKESNVGPDKFNGSSKIAVVSKEEVQKYLK